MYSKQSLLPYFNSCSQAAVDSQRVVLGSLFFALKGKRVDGHNYLEEVALRGAKGAVVKNGYEGNNFGMDLFHVDDPLKALQMLAKEQHALRNIPVIAITGSVGKTSTKEAVASLLSSKFVVGKTPGNANSQVGVPLAILNDMTGKEEIAVFEMGLTHEGNLSRLIEIAPPTIGVITSIGLVHAENFDSLEAIAKAKGEILSHPKTEWAVINRSIKNYPFRKIPTFYYDLSEAPLTPHLPDHLRENLAAAVKIARHFGLSEAEIESQVALIRPYERRFENFISQGVYQGVHIVNDAYNASELSMIAALKSLPKVPGKRIGVLGEMLELGRFSKECHERVATIAVEELDEVYLVGNGCTPILELFLTRGKKGRLFQDPRDLFDAVKEEIKMGDLVLLKGSRFWGLSEFAKDFK